LVTVYRCIAAFEEAGLVRRALYADGACLYVASLGEPADYHVVSRKDRHIETLDRTSADELERLLHGIEDRLRERGYTEVGHLVQFYGTPAAGAKPA
jgi:Fur family ferric uptake transcriptional regulator